MDEETHRSHREKRLDLRERHGHRIAEEDVSHRVRFLRDAGAVEDGEDQCARRDVADADDGLGGELSMPGPE